MKTLIVILSLAVVSLFSYNEETDSQLQTTLAASRINLFRLQYVPGCGYLIPIFIYEIPGVKQPVELKTETSSVIGVNNTTLLPLRIKWFYNDLNAFFPDKLKRNGKGC